MRTAILLCCVLGLGVLAAGCGGMVEDGGASSSEVSEVSEVSLVSDVSLVSEVSEVSEVSSSYCPEGYYLIYGCAAGPTHLFKYCHDYTSSKTIKHWSHNCPGGYTCTRTRCCVANGLATSGGDQCCSGHAHYSGSALVCYKP